MEERTITSGTEVPLRILDLVDSFRQLVNDNQQGTLNETTVRETFLNPFLEELGWDPRNRRHAPPGQRDVLLEDKLNIDGQTKAPDYAMVIRGERRFFVEAKRPSVNIDRSALAAFQIRRYSWSAGLPLGLLTDFEEIAVYDCRQMPELHDSPTVARIKYFRYDELAERWGELHSLFSKDAVRRGSLDAFAAEHQPTADATPIDEAFLGEIRAWRIRLARDIAENNQSLDVIQLNAEVQKLLDRLIFLRIAEARGLEPRNGLLGATRGEGSHYKRLFQIFRRADDRYNSGLFHFITNSPAGGVPDPGNTTLTVSNNALEFIIERMYYPHPYEFSALPADILGRIYEQFLGEQIYMDRDRNVHVDLKPEVRKAGGVYYTPSQVVDYIVEQTLGPLLEGKRPQEVAALRILDPACGSGSFLVAAYQYLIDWHRDYYADKVNLAKKHLEVTPDGSLRLNTAARREILTNNVYGVDIDAQAVEVTKLSLLLKVIEGQAQMELNVGRILPDLGNSIVCGNSLIEHDFDTPHTIDADLWIKYNPFNWGAQWPEILQRGGFDAVIGNPPYLNIDNVWGKGDPRSAYIKAKYHEVYTDKTDLLFYFLQRSAQLCRGEVGMIVSRSFLESHKARKLRGWLGKNVRFREILDFRHALVFPKAGINTAIVRFSKSKTVKQTVFRRLLDRSLPRAYTSETLSLPTISRDVTVDHSQFGSNAWLFGSKSVQKVIEKMDKAGEPVGRILHVGQGMQSGSNSAFTLDVDKGTFEQLNDAGLAYKRVPNSTVLRYQFKGKTPYVAFPNARKDFDQLPALLRDHLSSKREILEKRAAFKRGNCQWWQFTWPLHKSHLHRARIFSPYMASSNRFALDSDCEYLGLTDTTVLYDNDQPEDLRYILGVLNSRLLTFRFRFLGKLVGGGMIEYFENTVSKLPIPRRSPGDSAHDRIVALVEQRATAMTELESSLIKSDRDLAQSVIDSIDQRIEDIVVALFGLTAEDVSLIHEELTLS